MARDLYGELLARALQRRAPPGHFPAFVTPGEANLLRSQGGGVAPGGGQYMAGGIPAFFSEADPNPGYGGGAMGFEDFGTLCVPGGSQEGPSDMDIALGILGLAGGQAQSPHGHAVGEHGWSFEPTQDEISMAQQTLALHEEQQRQVQYEKQEARRVAAQRQATIEQDLARETQDRMNQIAAQSKIDQALARTPPAITVETVKPAHTLNLDFPHPGTNVANAAALQTALDIDILDPVEDKTHSVAITRGGLYSPFNIGGWGIHDTFEDDEGFEDTFEENVLSYEDIEAAINTPSLFSQSGKAGLNVGLEEALAAYEAQHQEEGLWDEPSIVAALEQGYPSNMVTTPVWSGTLQEAVTQSPLSFSLSQAQNDAAALAAALESDTLDPSYSTPSQTTPGFTGTISEPGTESFFEESLEQDQTPYSGDTEDSGPAAQQAALSMAQHEVNTGRMSQAQAFSALDAPIDRGGLGRFSPAVGWGINSETGLASFADLAALNAQDHQGYAINNPQPSEASILASQVFGRLNPTVTNAVIGLASLVAPGPVGFAATIAALMEEKGLLNIPAMRSIPGIQAISDILDIPRDFVAQIMEGITDPIGDVLSQGTEALANALSGIIGPEESTGLDDAGDFDGGGVDGGAPDIEIVPPIATDTDATPAPTARTFADVDDETRRRILANIISGLQRTGRPTEGVTAFGPLYGKNFPERSGDGVYEIQPYPRNTFA